jgi:hypothetical protein
MEYGELKELKDLTNIFSLISIHLLFIFSSGKPMCIFPAKAKSRV